MSDKSATRITRHDCGGLGCGFQPCICDTELRAADVARANEQPRFIVKFSDTDAEDVFFAGHGAENQARRYFNMKRTAWTCGLFKEIARG